MVWSSDVWRLEVVSRAVMPAAPRLSPRCPSSPESPHQARCQVTLKHDREGRGGSPSLRGATGQGDRAGRGAFCGDLGPGSTPVPSASLFKITGCPRSKKLTTVTILSAACSSAALTADVAVPHLPLVLGLFIPPRQKP